MDSFALDENFELDYEFSDPEGSSGTSSPTHADSVDQAIPSNCTTDSTSKASSFKNASETCLSYVPCATNNVTNNQHVSKMTLPQLMNFGHEPIEEVEGSSGSGRSASCQRRKFQGHEHQNLSSAVSAQNALLESTSIVNNHLPSSVTLPYSSYNNAFLSTRPSLFRPKLSKIVNLDPNSNSGSSTQLKVKIKKTMLCPTIETLPAPTHKKRLCDTTTVTRHALGQGYLDNASVTRPAPIQKESFVDTTSAMLPAPSQKKDYLENTSVMRPAPIQKKDLVHTTSGTLPAMTRAKGSFDTTCCSSLQISESWSHCHNLAVTEAAAANHQTQMQQTSVPTSLEKGDSASLSKKSAIKESGQLTLSPNLRGKSQIPYTEKVGEAQKLIKWDPREPAPKSRKRGRPPKNKKLLTDSGFGDALVNINVVAVHDTVSTVSQNMCQATTLECSTSIDSHCRSQTVSPSVVANESNFTSQRKSSKFNSNKGTMKSEAGHCIQTSFDGNLKMSGNRPAESTANKEVKRGLCSSRWGDLVETQVKGSLKLKSSSSSHVKGFAGSDDTSAFQCEKRPNKIPDKESLQFPPSSQILPTSSQGGPMSSQVISKSSHEASRPGCRKPGPKSKCSQKNSNLSKVSVLGHSRAADSEALKIQKRFLGIQMAIDNVARMASIDDVDFTKALPAKRKDLVQNICGIESSTKQCSLGADFASPHKVVKHSERQTPAAPSCKQYRNAQTLQKKYSKDPSLNRAGHFVDSQSSLLEISYPTIIAPMDSLPTQTGGPQRCLRVMEHPQQQAVKTSVRQPTEVGESPKTQFQDTLSTACSRSVQDHREDMEMHQIHSRFLISENRQLQTTTTHVGTNTSQSDCVYQPHSLGSAVNTSLLLNPAITIIHQDQVHLIPETLPRFCLPSNIEQGHQLRLTNNCAMCFQFRSRVDYLLPPDYVKHTNMMEKLSADPQQCDLANFPFRSVHVFMFYQPSDIPLPYMTLIPYYSLNDVADFHRLKMKNQTLHLIVNTDVVRRTRIPNGELVLVLENQYNVMLVYGVPGYQLDPLSFCSFIPNPTLDETCHTTDEVSPSIKTFRFVKVTTDSFVVDSRILTTTLNCRKISFTRGTGHPYQDASLQPTVSIGPNLSRDSCAEGSADVPNPSESEKPATRAADVYSLTDSFEGFDNTPSPSKNILSRLSDQVPVALHLSSSKLNQSIEFMFMDDEEDVTLVHALKEGRFLDGVLESGATSMPLTGKKEEEIFVRPCPARHKKLSVGASKSQITLANTNQNSNTVSAMGKSVQTEKESPRKMGNDAVKTFLNHPRIGMCEPRTPIRPIISSIKNKDSMMAAKLSPNKPSSSLKNPSEKLSSVVRKDVPIRTHSKQDMLRKLFSGKRKPKISKHQKSQKCGATDVNHLEMKDMRNKIVKPKERYVKRQCHPDPKPTPVEGTPSKKKISEPLLKYQHTPKRVSPMTCHGENKSILSTMTFDRSKMKPILISVDSLGELSHMGQAIAPVDEQQVKPQTKQQLTMEKPVLLKRTRQENRDFLQPSTSSHRSGQFSAQTTRHQTPPPLPLVTTDTSVTTPEACSSLKSNNVAAFMTLPPVSLSAVHQSPPLTFLQQPRPLLYQPPQPPLPKHKQPESTQPPLKQPPVAAKSGAVTRMLPRLLPKPPSALELHALPRQLTPSKKKLQALGGLYQPEVYKHEGQYFRLWRGYDADLVQRQATFIDKSVKELASSTVERHMCMVCDLCMTGAICHFRAHVNSKKHLHNTATQLRTMSDMLYRLRGYHLAPINVEEAAKHMELVNEEVEEVDAYPSFAVPPADHPMLGVTTTCPDQLYAFKDESVNAVAATAAGNNSNSTATILVPTTAHLLLPTSRSASSNSNNPAAAIYIPSTAQLLLPTATSTSANNDTTTTTTTILLPRATQMLLPTVSSTSSNDVNLHSSLAATQSGDARQTAITCFGSTNTVVKRDDMTSTTAWHLPSLPAAGQCRGGELPSVPSKASPSAVVLHHTFWHQLSVVKSIMEEEGLDDVDDSYDADRPSRGRLALPAAVAADDLTADHDSLEVKDADLETKPEPETTQMTVIIPPTFDPASVLNPINFAQTSIVNKYINAKASRYSNENYSMASDTTDPKEDVSKKDVNALVPSVSAYTLNSINLDSNVSSRLLSGRSRGTSIKDRLGPRNFSTDRRSQVNPFRCQPLSRKDFNSAIKCRRLTLCPVGRTADIFSQSGLSDDTGIKNRFRRGRGRGRTSLSNMVTRRSLADRLTFGLTPLIQPGDRDGFKNNQHSNDEKRADNCNDPYHSRGKFESVDTARKQSDVCVTDPNVNSITDTSCSQQSTPTTIRGGERCGSLASNVSIDSGIGLSVRLSDRIGPPKPKTPPPTINPNFLRRTPLSPYYPHPLVTAPEDLNVDTQNVDTQIQPSALEDDKTPSKRMNKFCPKNSEPVRKLFPGQASCGSVATTTSGTVSIVNDPLLEVKRLCQNRQNIVHGKFEAGMGPSSTSPEIYDLDSGTTKRKQSDAYKRPRTSYVDLDKPKANFIGYFDEKSGGFKMLNTIEANAGTCVAIPPQSGGNTSSLQPQPLNDNYDDSYSCMLQAVINMVSSSANPASEGLVMATPGDLMLPSGSGADDTAAESLVVSVDNTQEAQRATSYDYQTFCDTDSFMRDVLDFDVEENARSIMQNVDAVDASVMATSDATVALDFKANASNDNEGSKTNHDCSENPVPYASSENLLGDAPNEDDFTPVGDFYKDFELSDSESNDGGPVVVSSCGEDPLSTPRVTRCADWVQQNPLDACWGHPGSQHSKSPVVSGMQIEYSRFDGTVIPANFEEWKAPPHKGTRGDVNQPDDPPAIVELDEIDLQFSIESDDLYFVNSGKNPSTEVANADGIELQHSIGPDVDSDQLVIKQEARLDAFEQMLLRKSNAATEKGATNVVSDQDAADGQSAPLLVLSSEESVDGDEMTSHQPNALARETQISSTEVLSGVDVLAGMSEELLPPFDPNSSLPLVSREELCFALHAGSEEAMTGRCMSLREPTADRDISCKTVQESVLAQEQLLAKDWHTVERDERISSSDEYNELHRTKGGINVALHGAEEVRDVALHDTEEDKDVVLLETEEDGDVALHDNEEDRDVALHESEEDMDVALHEFEEDRDMALHGTEKDVDVALHKKERDEDVALPGAEGDEDVGVNTHHDDDSEEVRGETFTSSSSNSSSSCSTLSSSSSTDQENVCENNGSVLNLNENKALQNGKCDLDTSDMEEVGICSLDTDENVSNENNTESPNRYATVQTKRLFENSERDVKTDHDLDCIESADKFMTVQVGEEIKSRDENALTDVQRLMNGHRSVEVTLQTPGCLDNHLILSTEYNSQGDELDDAKNSFLDSNCHSRPINSSRGNPTKNAVEHNCLDVMTENTMINKIINMTLDKIDPKDTSLHIRDLGRPASNTAAVSPRKSCVDYSETVPGNNGRPSVPSTALLPSFSDKTYEDDSLRLDPICVPLQGSTQLASTVSSENIPGNKPNSSSIFLKTTQALSASKTTLTFDDVEVMTKNLSINNDEFSYESGHSWAQLPCPVQGANSARMFLPRKSVPFDFSGLSKPNEDVPLTSSPRNGQLAPFPSFAECPLGDENNPSWKVTGLTAMLRLGAPYNYRDANAQKKSSEVRLLTGRDEERVSKNYVRLTPKPQYRRSGFGTEVRSPISTDQSVSTSLSETTSSKPSLTVLQRPSLFYGRSTMGARQHTSGSLTSHLTEPHCSERVEASILLQKCQAETKIVKQNSLDSHHTDVVKSSCSKSGSWLRDIDNVKMISKLNSNCLAKGKATADNFCFSESSSNPHEVDKLQSSAHAVFKSPFNVGIQSKSQTPIAAIEVPEAESSSCSWFVSSCQATNVASSNPSSICTSPSDSINSNESAGSSITLNIISTLQKLGTNIRKRSATQPLEHEPDAKMKRSICSPLTGQAPIVVDLFEDEAVESKPCLSCDGGERSNYSRSLDRPPVIDISDDDDNTEVLTSSIPSQTIRKKSSDLDGEASVVDPFELSFCVREDEASSLLSDSDEEIEPITKKHIVLSTSIASSSTIIGSTFSRYGTSSDSNTPFNISKHRTVAVNSSSASASTSKAEPTMVNDTWTTFMSTTTSADSPLQSISSSSVRGFADRRFSQTSKPDVSDFTNFTQGTYSLRPSFPKRSDLDRAMSLHHEAASSNLFCSANADAVTTGPCAQFKTPSPFAITPGAACRDDAESGNNAHFSSQPSPSNIASCSTSNDSPSLSTRSSKSHTSCNDKPRSPIFKKPLHQPLKSSIPNISPSSRNLSFSSWTSCSRHPNGVYQQQVDTSGKTNVSTTKRSRSSNLCSRDLINPNPMLCPVDRRKGIFVPNPVHSHDNRNQADVCSNPAQYSDTRRKIMNPSRQPVHSRISFPSISSYWSRPSSCGTNSGPSATSASTENPIFGAVQRGPHGDFSSRPNQKSLVCNPLAVTGSLEEDQSAIGSLNPSFQPKNTVAPQFGSAFNNPGSSISRFPHLPARASVEAPLSSTHESGSNWRPAQPHDFFRTMVPMISPIRSRPSTRGVNGATSDGVGRGEAGVSAGGTVSSTPVATHEHHSVREFQDMWDQMLNKPTSPITDYQGR